MSDLKIKITGSLDSSKSVAELNRNIKEIEKKIQSLKLSINIDEKVIKTLDNFSKAMQKQQEIIKDLNKVLREEETVIKKTNGTVEKQITSYLKSGEIIKKNKTIITEKTNAQKEEAKVVNDLTVATDKLGKKQKEIQEQTARGNKNTEKYKNGFTDTTIVSGNDGVNKIITRNNIDNMEKFKAKQQDMVKQLKVMQTEGKITSTTFEKMSRAINTRESAEELAKLSNTMSVLNKNANRKSFDGELLGSSASLKSLKSANEENVVEALRLNKAIKNQDVLAASLNRTTGQWSVTVKEGSKQERTLKGEIDRTTGSIYKQSEAVRDASSKNLGFMEQFKVALTRVNTVAPLCGDM